MESRERSLPGKFFDLVSQRGGLVSQPLAEKVISAGAHPLRQLLIGVSERAFHDLGGVWIRQKLARIGLLVCSNAGHNPPLIIGAAGKIAHLGCPPGTAVGVRIPRRQLIPGLEGHRVAKAS